MIFKMQDGDTTSPAEVEVDNIGGTIGLEVRWVKPAAPGQHNGPGYACLSREDAIKLAQQILTMALEM